jgi:hypothetical protein
MSRSRVKRKQPTSWSAVRGTQQAILYAIDYNMSLNIPPMFALGAPPSALAMIYAHQDPTGRKSHLMM